MLKALGLIANVVYQEIRPQISQRGIKKKDRATKIISPKLKESLIKHFVYSRIIEFSKTL